MKKVLGPGVPPTPKPSDPPQGSGEVASASSPSLTGPQWVGDFFAVPVPDGTPATLNAFLGRLEEPSNQLIASFQRSPLSPAPPSAAGPRLQPASLPAHGMTFPPLVSEFEARQKNILDFLSGPNSQRIQRRVLAQAGPNYSAVMEELGSSGIVNELAHGLREKLLALAPPTGPSTYQYNQPISPAAIALLTPEEQRLVTNPHNVLSPYPTWLELRSNVHNALSLAFNAAMRPDGSIDAGQVMQSLGAPAVAALRRAQEAWTLRSPAERHWMANGREPFDPDDRAITQLELSRLERQHPDYFALLMESAPIPTHLPILSAVANSTGLDLTGCEVFLVQHCLGSLDGFLAECQARGAALTLVPVIYSKSAIVARKLKERAELVEQAQNLAVAPRDIERTMEVDVFNGLRASLRQAKERQKTFVAVDDGGWMIRLLSGRAKFLEEQGLGGEYRAFLREFAGFPIRIVEQTENGVREAERVIEAKGKLPAGVTLLPLGRAPCKLVDSVWVGYRGAYRLERELINLGKGNLQGKTLCQMGFGNTGEWLAKYARHVGARVIVHDTDPKAIEKAVEAGFEVGEDLEATLSLADVVVGSTGSLPLGKESLRSLKKGAVLVSTSSKALEFYNEHLAARDTPWLHPNHALGQHGEATVVAPGLSFAPNRTHHVVLKDANDPLFEKEYFVLNGLCPVGFDRQVNDFPPELAQILEAAKTQALAEILKTPPGSGMVPLSPEGNRNVSQTADRLRPGWRDELKL